MKSIYIAGPYSSDPEHNTELAIHVWHRLASLKFYPYCPHLSHFLDQVVTLEYEDYMRHCLYWVEQCDGLLRLHGTSVGADREVDHAIQHGVPVFYSVDDLLGAVV